MEKSPLENATYRRWATLTMVDGFFFEGVVAETASYGIYLHIGGDDYRVSMFPWHTVSRVTYKSE